MDFWCAEQLVVTVEGPAGRNVVSVAQPFARVGSHPDAEVVIADPEVARRCLYLHALPAGVYCLFLDIAIADITNQNSQPNGTWLDPDQDVVVGAYRIRASLLTAEAGDALPDENLAAWGSAPPPLPVMLVHCGGLLKDKRRFRARLSPVGRRPQCGLQLRGKKVSSFHCVLYWDREQLWCIDLNSSNGTTLNGEAIVCQRVGMGDQLDVGEFGLVFQRLSSGGGSPRLPGRQRESDDGAASQIRLEQGLRPVADRRESPVAGKGIAGSLPAPEPAVPHVSAVAAGPTLEQLARLEEERKLREQLADEVARLGRERLEMQSRWDQANQLLQAQINQLHDEAGRLASERQALEQSRGQWSDERAALTRQLGERSDELDRLKSELTATTSSLTDKLAELEQRSELARERERLPEQRPDNEPPLKDDLRACEFAPTTIIEGFSGELAGELALVHDRVQQVLPDLEFDYASAEPRDDPSGAESRRDVDSAQHLQAQWEATSERLTVQIEQLQAESAELSAQRQSLEQSRQDWQAERRLLTEQLTARAEQLARLEADLAATTAALAQRLAEAEQRTKEAESLPAKIADASLPSRDSPTAIDELLLAQIAPAAVVAGLETELDARFSPTSEVSWCYTPVDPADVVAALPDPQIEIQARWEETSERLSAQVEQLRSEATQLAAERLALTHSRDEWLEQRESITGQLAEHQQDLTRQQAELSAATSSLTAKLSDVQQRLEQPIVYPTPPPPPLAFEARIAEKSAEKSAEKPDQKVPIGQIDRLATPEGAPIAESTASRMSLFPVPPPPTPEPSPTVFPAQNTSQPAWNADDFSVPPHDAPEPKSLQDPLAADPNELDELTLFVSERLGKDEPLALRWLWWSAGGIGVAALLAVIVIVVIWAF